MSYKQKRDRTYSDDGFSEWFRARNWHPLAVGHKFTPPELPVLERPPATDDRTLGRYIRAIEEGYRNDFIDFSKHALVYDEKNFMYFFVKGE